MKRPFSIGFLFGLAFLIACNATFPYRWYGLDCGDCEGKLLGPKPKDDLSLVECRADAEGRGKCGVFKFTELDRLMSDYIDLQKRLEACESRE